MTANIRELLPLYALGALEPAEVDAVEAAVAGDPDLAAELASLQLAATELISPIPPSPAVRDRLMASIGGGRFESFSSRIASLWDVSVDQARELLGRIERPASWTAAMPGIELLHLTAGPACAEADCGFVRLAPGSAFPHHKHMGEEVSLILAGRLRDQSGQVLGPGEELLYGAHSEHDFACDGDVECIFAARVVNGIEIAGAPMPTPSKR